MTGKEGQLEELLFGPRAELELVAELLEHYAVGTTFAVHDLGGLII
ncbi:hypothetical protein [Dictyobacter kobayashii]|nr:hypothetical protein [Dictyobacter kobayashii]